MIVGYGLKTCCASVLDRYRAARGEDPRDGAALYCATCTSRIIVRTRLVDGQPFIVSAQTEAA